MTPRVLDAQRRLGLTPTGVLDDELIVAIRRFQMAHGQLVTGELDDETYRLIWQERLLGEA